MNKIEHETVPIAVTLEDGSLVIQHILRIGRGSFLPPGAVYIDSMTWKREVTDEGIEHNLERTFVNVKVRSWHRIHTGGLPKDRTFRDAWVSNGKTIEHDMKKAREIARMNIRHARASAMVELDAKYTRAHGQGDTAAAKAVEAQRQRLRDAPANPLIDAAQTVEELQTVLQG